MKHYTLRASTLAVPFTIALASMAVSQENSATDTTPAAVDISGELVTTEQALHFALSEDRVPNADTVKLERLDAQFSSKGNRWEFLFRDEDKTYEATVQQDRFFDLDKEFDEDGENAAFWATLPDPKDIEWPEQYLEQAMEVAETFNSRFTANPRALIEFEVCDPPEKDEESEYANGCDSDEYKEVWEVYLHISSEVRGEDQTFYKYIRFADGQPTEFKDANVSGNW